MKETYHFQKIKMPEKEAFNSAYNGKYFLEVIYLFEGKQIRSWGLVIMNKIIIIDVNS